MAFWTALFGLCLIEGFYAWRLTAPSALKSLEGTTQDGAALNIPDLQWEDNVCFPDSHWRLSAWVKILPNTADNARLLQVTGFSEGIATTCYATWTSTSPATFRCGTTDHQVTGAVAPVNRQTNAWIYLVMSSSAGNTRGHFFFRSSSNDVLAVSWAETILVTRTTSIVAPANANPFHVSCT